MKITGIILCGGESSRMGIDKGRCLLNGRPLIEYTIETLRKIVDTIIISSNGDGYNHYGYQVVKDEMPGRGPAGGIYSCLKASATFGNIVVSCDTPMITTELIQFIVTRKDNYDAVIPVFKGYLEPLCALYTKQCIESFENNIKSGTCKMQDIIKQVNCRILEIDQEQSFVSSLSFTNVNSLVDLVNLEDQLKRMPGNV